MPTEHFNMTVVEANTKRIKKILTLADDEANTKTASINDIPQESEQSSVATLDDLLKEVDVVEKMGSKKSILSLFKLVNMAVEIISNQDEKIRVLQTKLALQENQIAVVQEKLDGPNISHKTKNETPSYAAVAAKGLSVTGRVVLEMSKLENKKNNIIIKSVKESKKT